MTLAVLVGVLGACAAAEREGGDAIVHKPLIGPRDAVRQDLLPPASLAGAKLELWDEEQLARADLPKGEAVAQLPVPGYLAEGIEFVKQNPPDPPDPPDPLDQPTGAAVKHYLAGRDAFHRGRRDEAVEQLTLALEHDPRSAHTLALMGRVRFNPANTDRARGLFERALRIDPDQPDALFYNGQIAYREQHYQEAAVLLDRLANLEGRPVDAGLRYMGSYYVGLAMARQGYDRAAVEHLSVYLQEPERFTGNTRMVRQVAAIGRQRGAVQLQTGDMLLRLGRVRQALAYYGQAEQTERLRPELVNRRRVYAALLLGRSEDAERAVLNELLREKADHKSLPLVGYVRRHTDDAHRFAAKLRDAYETHDRRALLASAAMAAMDSDASADAFLVDVIAADPSRVDVFESWRQRVGDGDPARVLAATLSLVERVPGEARAIVGVLLDNRGDVQALLNTIATLDEASRDKASTLYVRGMCQAYLGELDRAEASLDAVLDRDPDYAPALLAIVDLAVRRGEHDKALAIIRSHSTDEMPRLKLYHVVVLQQKATLALRTGQADQALAVRRQAMGMVDELIAADPEQGEYRMAKAGLLRGAKDFAGAERELLAILNRDSKYEPAYELLFTVYEKDLADRDKFAQLLGRARRSAPNARITRLRVAQVHRYRSEFSEAESLYRLLLRDNSRDGAALRDMVLLYQQQQRMGDAQAFLVELLEREPDNAPAVELLRQVAKQTGDTDAYYARYEAYLGFVRNDIDKHRRLAQLYAEWGKTDLQVAALEAALAIDATNAESIYLQLALAHHQAERFDEALAATDQAIALKPKDVVGYATKAYLLMQQERGDDAVALLDDAIRAGTANRLELREVLADVHFKLGRLDEALAELERVIAGSPKRKVALRYRQANYAYGDPPRAEGYLKQVLALDPDHVGANNDLAYAWAEEDRNLAKAEQMARKAVSAEPTRPAYIDSLGWVLYKRGRFVRAAALLQKAYELPDGKDAVIIDHYGDALWRAGMQAQAEARWREALATFDQRTTDQPLLADEQTLRRALEAKLEAVEAGRQPPIATVPTAVEEDEPPDPPLPGVQ